MTKIVVLILAPRRAATLLATTLPAALAALTTLPALTALLLAVTLSRITRVRASHNPSNAKVNVDSGNCSPNVAASGATPHPPRG